MTGQGQLVFEDKNWTTRVIGAVPEYAPMRNRNPLRDVFHFGRKSRRLRVALVGQTVQKNLSEQKTRSEKRSRSIV